MKGWFTMKLKGTFFRTILCAMLFVMTFTSLTVFAAEGDIINAKYLGTYYNTTNNKSHFTIRSDSDYPIVAINVYSVEDNITFNGSGSTVVINYAEFGANFDKVRKVNEEGLIEDDRWYYNVTLIGKCSSSLFGGVITVTMPDLTNYVKK